MTEETVSEFLDRYQDRHPRSARTLFIPRASPKEIIIELSGDREGVFSVAVELIHETAPHCHIFSETIMVLRGKITVHQFMNGVPHKCTLSELDVGTSITIQAGNTHWVTTESGPAELLVIYRPAPIWGETFSSPVQVLVADK